MSKRSDRADERKAVKQAQKDLDKAGTAARKAFDLKDPRFLGEAAVAATRGPVGLALFGASRGIQVIRDRRAEQAELLGDLAADARQHASALREQTSALATPPQKRNPLRRFAPLWIVGLAGGAAGEAHDPQRREAAQRIALLGRRGQSRRLLAQRGGVLPRVRGEIAQELGLLGATIPDYLDAAAGTEEGQADRSTGGGDCCLAQEAGVLEVERLPGGGAGLVQVLLRLLDGLTLVGAIASFAHG